MALHIEVARARASSPPRLIRPGQGCRSDDERGFLRFVEECDTGVWCVGADQHSRCDFRGVEAGAQGPKRCLFADAAVDIVEQSAADDGARCAWPLRKRGTRSSSGAHDPDDLGIFFTDGRPAMLTIAVVID